MINSWNDFVFIPVGGFLLVFIGSLLLFAEVLVKGRFIFGVIGLGLMSVYFTSHIQEGMAVWMGLSFILGIVLVILDGKFIGDGTIGGIGLLVMLVSLALPAPSMVYGISVVAAFLFGALGSLLFPKYLPRREVWTKLVLQDSLTSEKGYNSLSDSYRALVGQEGIAQTDFRPTGTIKINESVYSAMSEGMWIEKGTRLKVREVNGARILVDPIDDSPDPEKQ